MIKAIVFIFVCIILFASSLTADSVSWSRGEDTGDEKVEIFRSRDAVNLPTALTLSRKNLEFIISHRFFPPISEGYEALYGFDGPVNVRIGLSYGLTDDIMITLGRSNVNDNLDLQLRYRVLQINNETIPVLVAVSGGFAWNYETFLPRRRADSRNFQYFGQLIANVRLFSKAVIGVVPSVLYNSDIASADEEHTIILGGYAQYYLSSLFSLLAEANLAVSDYHKQYDSFGMALVIETGGHFFKIAVTNNVSLNQSQFLTGSEYEFKPDEWRLGFNITRLLKFW